MSLGIDRTIRIGQSEAEVELVLGHTDDRDGYGNGDMALLYPGDIAVVVNQRSRVVQIIHRGRQVSELQLTGEPDHAERTVR